MSRIQLVIAMKFVVIAAILIKSPDTLAGVFKCTDARGATTYQSMPCGADTTQSKISLKTNPSPSDKGAPPTPATPDVVLYSTAWCGYCKKVRKLFAENNVPFKELDIETSAQAKKQYDKLQGKGVPLTTVGETLVRGYNPKLLLRLIGPQ